VRRIRLTNCGPRHMIASATLTWRNREWGMNNSYMERAQSIIDMRQPLALARDITSAVFSALAHTVPVKRKAILEIPTSDIRSLTPRQHRLQQKARQRYATPGHNSAIYPGEQYCYHETVLFARRAHQIQRINAREPTTHTTLQIR
jgi:hypothetical protein